MISWIAAAHDETILYANLVASLHPLDDDELIIIEDALSIAAAYNEGQDMARHPIRCYLHSDIQILDLPRLRAELIEHTTGDVGLVGLVGSRTPVLPWWDGKTCGSVIDARIGPLNFGPGGDCAVLDGLLLATAQDVVWDEKIPGWHGYDHDMSRQQLAAGRRNFCLTDGAEMVRHNADSSRDPDQIDGWQPAVEALRQKWGD